MAITYTLQVPTVEKYDLKLNRIPEASLAKFALVDYSASENVRTALYTYGDGDAADVLHVTTKKQYVPKSNMTNCSIRVSALLKGTDSVSGAVTYEPVESVIAWNHTGKFALDQASLVTLVSIGMSLFAQELTGTNDVPTTKVVSQFDHDIVVTLI